jgi:hypothetical protein
MSTRRAFFTTAAALPLAGASAIAAPSGIPPEITALIAEVRAAHAAYMDKLTSQRDAEGQPGCAAAEAASEQAFADFEALHDAIAERPVRHWFDLLPVAALAEIEGLEACEPDTALLFEGLLRVGDYEALVVPAQEPTPVAAREPQTFTLADPASQRDMQMFLPDGRKIGDTRGNEVLAVLATITAPDPMLPCGTPTSAASDAQKADAKATYARLHAQHVEVNETLNRWRAGATA